MDNPGAGRPRRRRRHRLKSDRIGRRPVIVTCADPLPATPSWTCPLEEEGWPGIQFHPGRRRRRIFSARGQHRSLGIIGKKRLFNPLSRS